MNHRDFFRLVQRNWYGELSIVENLAKLRSIVLDWNREVYGNIF